jgi:hypothetical protein
LDVEALAGELLAPGQLYFLIDGLLDRLMACAIVPHEETP